MRPDVFVSRALEYPHRRSKTQCLDEGDITSGFPPTVPTNTHLPGHSHNRGKPDCRFDLCSPSYRRSLTTVESFSAEPSSLLKYLYYRGLGVKKSWIRQDGPPLRSGITSRHMKPYTSVHEEKSKAHAALNFR
jgi:hypothetical protein